MSYPCPTEYSSRFFLGQFTCTKLRACVKFVRYNLSCCMNISYPVCKDIYNLHTPLFTLYHYQMGGKNENVIAINLSFYTEQK